MAEWKNTDLDGVIFDLQRILQLFLRLLVRFNLLTQFFVFVLPALYCAFVLFGNTTRNECI